MVPGQVMVLGQVVRSRQLLRHGLIMRPGQVVRSEAHTLQAAPVISKPEPSAQPSSGTMWSWFGCCSSVERPSSKQPS